MAFLPSLRRWLGMPAASPQRGAMPFQGGLLVEEMEHRRVMSTASMLNGTWFVESNGGAASITPNGNQLQLTNENGTPTTGEFVNPTTFQAWGHTAEVVEDGSFTRILWDGNTWIQSAYQRDALGGQWYVQSNGMQATILQTADQLVLTNEHGVQETAQWVSPTQFTAWGQTARIEKTGSVTQIIWNGNTWTQSDWQKSGLKGQWFVQSSTGSARIDQTDGQIILTNEQGTQTLGQWLGPTSFSAWGQTARIVEQGDLTWILWNGNSWSQSRFQRDGLSGKWFVQSNGQMASITQIDGQLLITNEQGTQTVGQWVSPTSFQAFGQTAQITSDGVLTQIQWNGNSWAHSRWQDQGLTGTWFVQSNGLSARLDFTSEGKPLLTNEQGTQTIAEWASPTSFQAWGVTAQITQNGAILQIQWDGNTWARSAWQTGDLAGAWFVQSNEGVGSIAQQGDQLILTNELGTTTMGHWLSPTTFQAWGQTGQVGLNGTTLVIQWNGNTWMQSRYNGQGLSGLWQVQSNGQAASIIPMGDRVLLTNEQGSLEVGHWITQNTFAAWGQVAQILQNGANSYIQWDGNTWTIPV